MNNGKETIEDYKRLPYHDLAGGFAFMGLMKRLLGKRASSAPRPSVTEPKAKGRDLPEKLRNQFDGSDDVRFRQIDIDAMGVRAVLVYVEGLVDSERIEESVTKPLLRGSSSQAAEQGGDKLEALRSAVLPTMQVRVEPGFEEAVAAVLEGDLILAIEGEKRGLKIANRGSKARGVEDPALEVTIRGPRDAFTETLMWNIALVRRRVRDPNLRVKMKKVGRRSRTDVALLYIEGITPSSLVQEVQRRLDAVDIDGILDTGYLEQLMEDEWYSPFPQHHKTERPDRVVASLLEGRAALLADTTPLALMMPATLDGFFHSPEDSYDRFWPVNILRMVRFVASIFGVLGPALYVSLVAYHPNILPTEFVLRIHATREGVAFPVIVEAFLMQFFLELIKEAGLRLPGPLGQTFGIVGGLILGEIGIRAGLVSEAMVIVVAATAISTFTSIDREVGTILRLLGLPIMISAAVFGLYGLIMAALFVGIHLVTLRSYGVPYFAPYVYYNWRDIRDTVFKAPLGSMRRRPSYLQPQDAVRMDSPEEGSSPKGNPGP